MSPADPTDRNPNQDRINRERERMSPDYGDDEDDPRTPMEPNEPGSSRRGGRGRGIRSTLSGLMGSGLLGGNDPMTRRLLYGAAGLGGLLIVLVGGWSLFGHHQNGIPVIGPPPGPLRVKPVDPGGMQVLGTDAAGDGADGGHMAPGPEQPQPDAMARQYGQATTPEPPANAPPAQGQAPAQVPGVQSEPLASAQPESAPLPPAPAPSTPPAASQPAPAPAAAAQQDEAQEDEGTAPAAPAAAPAHGATGRYGVQLAALDSEAAAQKSWERLQRQYASLFGDRQPAIVRAERNGTTFYRLRVKGFATTAEASAFCQQVKAHGLACNPVRF